MVVLHADPDLSKSGTQGSGASKSVMGDLVAVSKMPQLLPGEVTLNNAIKIPLVFRGKQTGYTTWPAASRCRLLAIQEQKLLISRGGYPSATVDPAETDFWKQVVGKELLLATPSLPSSATLKRVRPEIVEKLSELCSALQHEITPSSLKATSKSLSCSATLGTQQVLTMLEVSTASATLRVDANQNGNPKDDSLLTSKDAYTGSSYNSRGPRFSFGPIRLASAVRKFGAEAPSFRVVVYGNGKPGQPFRVFLYSDTIYFGSIAVQNTPIKTQQLLRFHCHRS
jgi:hypothetical protein